MHTKRLIYFSTKTFVVDMQKNHHDETVLFSTQNTYVKTTKWIRKYLQFYVIFTSGTEGQSSNMTGLESKIKKNLLFPKNICCGFNFSKEPLR